MYFGNWISLEPMGSKAPAFSTDATSIAFVRFVHTGFGLLCQAQGFPVPLFRQVKFFKFVLCIFV